MTKGKLLKSSNKSQTRMTKARMTSENHKCGKNSKEESKSQNMVKIQK